MIDLYKAHTGDLVNKKPEIIRVTAPIRPSQQLAIYNSISPVENMGLLLNVIYFMVVLQIVIFLVFFIYMKVIKKKQSCSTLYENWITNLNNNTSWSMFYNFFVAIQVISMTCVYIYSQNETEFF